MDGAVLLYWVLVLVLVFACQVLILVLVLGPHVLVLVLVRKYLLPRRIFCSVSDTHLHLSDQGPDTFGGGDFRTSPKKFWPGL